MYNTSSEAKEGGLPVEVLECLAEEADGLEWLPEEGPKLKPEAWQEEGSEGWLLEVIRGEYGPRWVQGMDEDAVEDYDRLAGGSQAVRDEDDVWWQRAFNRRASRRAHAQGGGGGPRPTAAARGGE